MNNYKVNINRKPPTPEEIAKLRNFDQVFGQINGAIQPFYKKLWFITSAAAALIVGLVSTVIILSNQKNPGLDADRPFITPSPIAIKYDTYTVDCTDSTGIITASGAIIAIPKGSLVDDKGNVITGKVDVKYREFKDAADFICSGIPMTYDSAGTHYYFESAGMFDINAMQNEKGLRVADQKALQVTLSSGYDPQYYNQYYLDTVNKCWVYTGKDRSLVTDTTATVDPYTIAAVNTKVDSSTEVTKGNDATTATATQMAVSTDVKVAQARKEIVSLQQTRPVAPVKANPKKTHFNFNLDMKDFPEMAAYSNILFDVGDENKNFQENYYDVTWENVKMEEGPKKGVNFKMTLSRRNQTLELIVYPVFEGKNYEAAKAQYAQMLAEYNTKLALKAPAEKEAIAEAKTRFDEEKKKAEEASKQAQAAIERKQKEYLSMDAKERLDIVQNSQIFWHVVDVTKMGVWNNDAPKVILNKKTIYTTCIDHSENELPTAGDVYLIDKNRNACIMYHTSSYTDDVLSYTIDFNTQATNMLVTITKGKFAIVTPEKFKEYTLGKSSIKIKYEIMEDVSSVEDLRQLLQL